MKKCNCNPEIMLDEPARYANLVALELPEWSTERARRLKEGMSTAVCIDPCIVEDIKHLWENGVETLGCCCGHNVISAWVYVTKSSVQSMKELGFRNLPDGESPNHDLGFILFDLQRLKP